MPIGATLRHEAAGQGLATAKRIVDDRGAWLPLETALTADQVSAVARRSCTAWQIRAVPVWQN